MRKGRRRSEDRDALRGGYPGAKTGRAAPHYLPAGCDHGSTSRAVLREAMSENPLSPMHAVVVAGGPAGNDAFVRAHVARADLLIAADAGVLLLERLGIRPDLAIGDFDTAGAEIV